MESDSVQAITARSFAGANFFFAGISLPWKRIQIFFSVHVNEFNMGRAGNLLILSERIACFLRKNERMSDSLKKTSNLLIRSFLVSDLSHLLTSLIFVSILSDSLTSLIKKEGMRESLIFLSQKTYIKHTKNKILAKFFLSKSLIRSFIMNDLSESFTMAYLSWATWAICSRSLFDMSDLSDLERSERIAHSCLFDLREMSKWVKERWAKEWWAKERWANERWANEQIPSPEYGPTFYVL